MGYTWTFKGPNFLLNFFHDLKCGERRFYVRFTILYFTVTLYLSWYLSKGVFLSNLSWLAVWVGG